VTDTVHQILWAYEDRGGAPGIKPVAGSLGADELADWHAKLRAYVRMTDAGHLRRPRASLCYLHLQGQAVLMRRIRGATENRNDQCHALIAPARALPPQMAASSLDWALWSTERRDPQAILDASLLDREYQQFGKMSQTRARREQQPITVLVAAILRDPASPVSAVSAEGWDGRTCADTVLRGAFDVLRGLIVGAIGDGPERWTFSTHETDHARDHLPWLVFGPPVGDSAFPVARTVVEPLAAPPIDVAHRVAEEMVREYARGGHTAVDELLRAADVRQTDHVADRVSVLGAYLGIAPVPVGGPLADHGAAAPGPLPSALPVAREYPRTEAHEPIRSSPPAQRPGRVRNIDPRRMDDDSVVRLILDTDDSDLIREAIQEIARRHPIPDVKTRRAARTRLARANFGHARLRGLLRPQDLHWALYNLIRFVLTPDDLQRPDQPCPDLADLRTPYVVVETIGRYAADQGLAAVVAPRLGNRWLAERGIDTGPAGPAAGHPAMAGGRDLLDRIRAWEWTPVALLGSGLLTLLLAVLTIAAVTT
jgi:hypothetical protein